MSTRPHTVSVAPNARGAILTKYIVCLVMAHDNPLSAAEIAADRVRGLPQLVPGLRQKAAIGGQGLTSTDPYLGGEWFGALASDVEEQIVPLFSPAPFRVGIPVEAAAGGAGAWVGQGLSIPNFKSTTSTITLDYFKLAAAVAFTRELARFGRVAEAAMLKIIRAAWDKAVTQQMLDSTIGATINRPASLTFGCNKITSTGSSAAQITTDLSGMIAAIQSPGLALRWIMRPLTFFRIAAALGGAGLNVSRDDLFGIACVLASNSPKQVTLLDCDAVACATDDGVDVNVTSEASIEMSDAPGQTGIVGTGATMVSCYQSDLVAAKIDRGMSWRHLFYGGGSPTVPAGCVYMPVTY
jgi:hypothetical protein